MNRLLSFAGGVAVLAAVLGGCGSSDSDGSEGSASPVSADDLDGTTYVSTSVEGHDLVTGTEVTLGFDDGSLAVSAGCNTQTADYELNDETLQWTGDPAATMKACSDELAAQEEWLRSLFVDGVNATADGSTLTLSDGDVTLELTGS
jgi:heat shock protein HslJ